MNSLYYNEHLEHLIPEFKQMTNHEGSWPVTNNQHYLCENVNASLATLHSGFGRAGQLSTW